MEDEKMKLNAMVLSINDRLPALADFKRMLETGNSRFWKGVYLYVVEQALIADRYYWLYLQYDNANLYAPHVVDITDDAVKDNPRPKNQVEMRNQLFACYDLRSGSLYVSDYQRKTAITCYMEDTLQCAVKAKYVFSSIDEFLGRVGKLKSVSFTQRRNLYNFPNDSLLRKVANIYGLDLPERCKVRLDYGDTLIGTIRDALRDWKVRRDAGEFEDIVVVGVDDHGFEEVFNFQTTISSVEANVVKDDNGRYDPDAVKVALINQLGGYGGEEA
jgi:hypothetical protein